MSRQRNPLSGGSPREELSGRGERMHRKPEVSSTGNGKRRIMVRLEAEVVDQMDAAVARHRVFPNRTTWLLNAILEQLAREEEGV